MVAIVVVMALVLVPAVRRSIEAKGKMTCASNLKQIGVALRMYAQTDHREMYPPMQYVFRDDEVTLVSVPHMALLYPDYLADPSVIICPRDDVRVGDLQDKSGKWCFTEQESEVGCAERTGASYVYWGWMVDRVRLDDMSLVDSLDSKDQGTIVVRSRYQPAATEPHFELFLDAVTAKLESAVASRAVALAVDSDLDIGLRKVAGAQSPFPALRLRSAIERWVFDGYFGGMGPSNMLERYVWTMYEALDPPSKHFPHQPHGGHVLYMDGHVEFVELDDKPPMVSAMGPYLNGIVRYMPSFR